MPQSQRLNFHSCNMARKYISKGLPRKKHVVKRQNLDAKRSVDTPIDKRGGFYRSDNISDWCGCKATANFPNLF